MMNSVLNKNVNGARWFALGLGWFSIILGLLGVFGFRRMARVLGTPNRPMLFRLLGLRELVTGLGTLMGRQKARGLWSRVFGDVMDLALLGAAFRSRKSDKSRLGFAAGGIAAVTLVDTVAALLHTPNQPVHVVKTITVSRSPEELYGAVAELRQPAAVHGKSSIGDHDR